MMNATTKPSLKKRLANSDWQVGDADSFLALTLEESAMVDIRLALADAALQTRLKHDLSQAQLAKRMGSSQSRIAKIEAADPSVSLDLMVKALLAAGAGVSDVARALRVKHVA
jgi:ribosome-binding protein aMBF1 (putative translation factor)